MRKKHKYIIGIDEVGRGCLAGPVVVAALALPIKFKIKPVLSENSKFKIPLKDSKKLTAKQREIWFKYVKKFPLQFAVASISPKIIDRINISQAANLAATKAFKKLIARGLTVKAKIFLDGGLYIDKKTLVANGYALNPKTIIKGDEKIPAISLASIMAKVYRDKLMKKFHKKYPQYGFMDNVGYGTKKHIKAIKKFGYSKIHRKSFKIIL